MEAQIVQESLLRLTAHRQTAQDKEKRPVDTMTGAFNEILSRMQPHQS